MSGKQKKRERAALKERLVLLEKEASLGNADAQVSLGYIYCERSSLLGPINITKAIYWLKKAADQGHEEGLLSMAGFYFNGHGVEQDIELSYRYLYEYHKKIGSEQYQTWIESGLDVEDFIDDACWHYEIQNIIKNGFKSFCADRTNFDKDETVNNIDNKVLEKNTNQVKEPLKSMSLSI